MVLKYILGYIFFLSSSVAGRYMRDVPISIVEILCTCYVIYLCQCIFLLSSFFTKPIHVLFITVFPLFFHLLLFLLASRPFLFCTSLYEDLFL